jgi:hypothetical protein
MTGNAWAPSICCFFPLRSFVVYLESHFCGPVNFTRHLISLKELSLRLCSLFAAERFLNLLQWLMVFKESRLKRTVGQSPDLAGYSLWLNQCQNGDGRHVHCDRAWRSSSVRKNVSHILPRYVLGSYTCICLNGLDILINVPDSNSYT